MTITDNTASLSRNATVDIPVNMLGVSIPHLVRPLDDRHIAELVETDETEWEPIEVRVWPANWPKPTPEVAYHVVSGNHRTCAAQMKKLFSLPARVIEAQDDLSYMLAAIRTNARHGKNFTEDDRRDLAAKLKALGQSVSDIAKLFGVHRGTVHNWLSGRDSNASRKATAEKKAEGMRLLAAAEAEAVDQEWADLPDVSVDEVQLVQTRRDIIDFLRTPATIDKTHVATLVRTLEIEDIEPMLSDMQIARRWLANVTALLSLQSGARSGSSS